VAPKSTTVEVVLARIASRQHGLVTRAQLVAAGLTADEIRHRLESGALLREHWGVYRVGHRAPSLEARYMAAVLACGEGACLSGRAAAHVLGLLKGPPPPPEVSAPVKRRANGVKVRRSRIDARDQAIHRGIPITAVPRTLIDLAADLRLDALARACHEAGVRYNITPRHLAAALGRRPANTPGTPNLKRIIDGDALVTLSALERRFLAMLREHALPLPQTNRPAGSHRVDCRWPERRLTVELDSYRFHHSRHAWEQDRRREREARARGADFRRYPWADVFEGPEATVAELRAVLIPAAPARSPPRST
jgi:very-short-patch-repair endonuclease